MFLFAAIFIMFTTSNIDAGQRRTHAASSSSSSAASSRFMTTIEISTTNAPMVDLNKIVFDAIGGSGGNTIDRVMSSHAPEKIKIRKDRSIKFRARIDAALTSGSILPLDVLRKSLPLQIPAVVNSSIPVLPPELTYSLDCTTPLNMLDEAIHQHDNNADVFQKALKIALCSSSKAAILAQEAAYADVFSPRFRAEISSDFWPVLDHAVANVACGSWHADKEKSAEYIKLYLENKSTSGDVTIDPTIKDLATRLQQHDEFRQLGSAACSSSTDSAPSLVPTPEEFYAIMQAQRKKLPFQVEAHRWLQQYAQNKHYRVNPATLIDTAYCLEHTWGLKDGHLTNFWIDQPPQNALVALQHGSAPAHWRALHPWRFLKEKVNVHDPLIDAIIALDNPEVKEHLTPAQLKLTQGIACAKLTKAQLILYHATTKEYPLLLGLIKDAKQHPDLTLEARWTEFQALCRINQEISSEFLKNLSEFADFAQALNSPFATLAYTALAQQYELKIEKHKDSVHFKRKIAEWKQDAARYSRLAASAPRNAYTDLRTRATRALNRKILERDDLSHTLDAIENYKNNLHYEEPYTTTEILELDRFASQLALTLWSTERDPAKINTALQRAFVYFQHNARPFKQEILNRINTLVSMTDFDTAEDLINKLNAVAPKNKFVSYCKGHLAMTRNLPAEAIQQFKKAAKLGSRKSRLQAAQIMAQSDDPATIAKARKYCKKADPSEKTVLANLIMAMIQDKEHNYPEAHKYLAQTATIADNSKQSLPYITAAFASAAFLLHGKQGIEPNLEEVIQLLQYLDTAYAAGNLRDNPMAEKTLADVQSLKICLEAQMHHDPSLARKLIIYTSDKNPPLVRSEAYIALAQQQKYTPTPSNEMMTVWLNKAMLCNPSPRTQYLLAKHLATSGQFDDAYKIYAKIIHDAATTPHATPTYFELEACDRLMLALQDNPQAPWAKDVHQYQKFLTSIHEKIVQIRQQIANPDAHNTVQEIDSTPSLGKSFYTQPILMHPLHEITAWQVVQEGITANDPVVHELARLVALNYEHPATVYAQAEQHEYESALNTAISSPDSRHIYIGERALSQLACAYWPHDPSKSIEYIGSIIKSQAERNQPLTLDPALIKILDTALRTSPELSNAVVSLAPNNHPDEIHRWLAFINETAWRTQKEMEGSLKRFVPIGECDAEEMDILNQRALGNYAIIPSASNNYQAQLDQDKQISERAPLIAKRLGRTEDEHAADVWLSNFYANKNCAVHPSKLNAIAQQLNARNLSDLVPTFWQLQKTDTLITAIEKYHAPLPIEHITSTLFLTKEQPTHAHPLLNSAAKIDPYAAYLLTTIILSNGSQFAHENWSKITQLFDVTSTSDNPNLKIASAPLRFKKNDGTEMQALADKAEAIGVECYYNIAGQCAQDLYKKAQKLADEAKATKNKNLKKILLKQAEDAARKSKEYADKAISSPNKCIQAIEEVSRFLYTSTTSREKAVQRIKLLQKLEALDMKTLSPIQFIAIHSRLQLLSEEHFSEVKTSQELLAQAPMTLFYNRHDIEFIQSKIMKIICTAREERAHGNHELVTTFLEQLEATLGDDKIVSYINAYLASDPAEKANHWLKAARQGSRKAWLNAAYYLIDNYHTITDPENKQSCLANALTYCQHGDPENKRACTLLLRGKIASFEHDNVLAAQLFTNALELAKKNPDEQTSLESAYMIAKHELNGKVLRAPNYKHIHKLLSSIVYIEGQLQKTNNTRYQHHYDPIARPFAGNYVSCTLENNTLTSALKEDTPAKQLHLCMRAQKEPVDQSIMQKLIQYASKGNSEAYIALALQQEHIAAPTAIKTQLKTNYLRKAVACERTPRALYHLAQHLECDAATRNEALDLHLEIITSAQLEGAATPDYYTFLSFALLYKLRHEAPENWQKFIAHHECPDILDRYREFLEKTAERTGLADVLLKNGIVDTSTIAEYASSNTAASSI